LAADRLGESPSEVLDGSDLIDALTPEMLQQAARRYLPADNYVRVSLYPEKDDWQ
jgi:predicted Zn-dependent peptidase